MLTTTQTGKSLAKEPSSTTKIKRVTPELQINYNVCSDNTMSQIDGDSGTTAMQNCSFFYADYYDGGMEDAPKNMNMNEDEDFDAKRLTFERIFANCDSSAKVFVIWCRVRLILRFPLKRIGSINEP
jgi:hypothetical protein